MAIIMSGVSSSDIEHAHRVARAWGRPLADREQTDVKSDIVIITKPESTSESHPTNKEEAK